jgi:ATP-dependent DNA helicase RecG
LPQEEKAQVLARFKRGITHILVATSIIEVGVDAPKAQWMIIENAERLGLAQLHQLRGRVGRGMQASTCIMLYKSPLTDVAKKRLALVRRCQDGLRIAEADLKLRGSGELLGARQSGSLGLQIADLVRHRHLLADVKRVAESMLATPAQAEVLCQRWINKKQPFMQV